MNVLRFLLLEDSVLDTELAQAMLTERGIAYRDFQFSQMCLDVC
ncbi:hypothetical protein [Nostoc sp. KVJ3]|nr:hypothetical protein [Nostoc sp. KVJ3]